MKTPEYIFETSWEVCNKVGGIYAVLSTRAASMQQICKDKVFFIGPDIWEDKENPCFQEDPCLLSEWTAKAAAEGLSVRIGRWLIPGKPIAILVEFRSFLSHKNDIYGEVWEHFRVDSLHAYGDYDESSMFGWAAGKVIESLYSYLNLSSKRVVAHFNEWMTAFGLFYVKTYLPRVRTLFTTHATSIGRSIAGNNKPLYDYFEGYHGDQMARELNMESKHSVEKQAAHYADCFTTVSDLTNRECKQLLDKPADIVTPNGFESGFIPKTETAFARKRTAAQRLLRKTASHVLGYNLPKDSLLVGISGRYEWKNKGIDMFLSSLNLLNHQAGRTITAFIMVPAWHGEAFDAVAGNGVRENPLSHITTHRLYDPEHDPVLNTMRYYGMNNAENERVKVIFIPAYLTGNDGVLNKSYYDLLIGLDLTIFPSYYEPWGYTPLESIAFRVPTLTTDLAGFGIWANKFNKRDGWPTGVMVCHRTDSNFEEATNVIARAVGEYAGFSEAQRNECRCRAASIAEHANWKHFFEYYLKAYQIALSK